MTNSARIMYNTIALYIKIFLTTIISLFLTRIVLKQLGTEDFGIYNLIGGVIALLAFMQTALSISTQRYLSVAMGKNDKERVKKIFSSGVLIHIAFACFIVFVFELFSPFIFGGFLKISPDRLDAAKLVYQIMIVSTSLSILTVPYNSVINAHEDIWLFALIEIISTLIKLIIIFIFAYVEMDSLILYALWMLFSIFIGVMLKHIWCFLKYDECTLTHVFDKDNYVIAKEMLGFTGWNAFGSLALIGRNQGVAILINIFWGTTINAVYGISNQVNGQLIHISQTMTQAMTPQITKSYGLGDYDRMKRLSFFASKMAFFLSAVFALPLIVELPEVLHLWLGVIPKYTETYISLCLIMFLIMELYPGIARAIQATGKIRYYQVMTSVLLLLPIPFGYLLYSIGFRNETILYLMIISQILQLIFAVYYGNQVKILDVNKFIRYLFNSTLIFILSVAIIIFLKNRMLFYFSSMTVIFIVIPFSMISFSLFYYIIVFDKNEKSVINKTILSLLNKYKR